jgi:hypothetical protein
LFPSDFTKTLHILHRKDISDTAEANENVRMIRNSGKIANLGNAEGTDETAVITGSTKMEHDKDVKNIRWLQQLCEEPAGLTGKDAERFASTLAVILAMHRSVMHDPYDPERKPLLVNFCTF